MARWLREQEAPCQEGRSKKRARDDGREEVLVTGRRSSLPEAKSGRLPDDGRVAPPEPPRAEQVALFGE